LDEDKLLIKRKDTDDDGDDNEDAYSNQNQNIQRIRNPLEISSSSSENSSEMSSSSNYISNSSNNINNTLNTLISFKSLVFSLVLIYCYSKSSNFHRKKNKTIHFFTDTDSSFKCEEGFYSAGQILATKYKELDWIWIMVLLALGLTMLFNI
jgi:hypothetical protein